MKCKVKSSFDNEIIQQGSVYFVQFLRLVENIFYVALQALLLCFCVICSQKPNKHVVLLQECNIFNGRFSFLRAGRLHLQIKSYDFRFDPLSCCNNISMETPDTYNSHQIGPVLTNQSLMSFRHSLSLYLLFLLIF